MDEEEYPYQAKVSGRRVSLIQGEGGKLPLLQNHI